MEPAFQSTSSFFFLVWVFIIKAYINQKKSKPFQAHSFKIVTTNANKNGKLLFTRKNVGMDGLLFFFFFNGYNQMAGKITKLIAQLVKIGQLINS